MSLKWPNILKHFSDKAHHEKEMHNYVEPLTLSLISYPHA